MSEVTTPGKEEVELRREQQPRATQGVIAEMRTSGLQSFCISSIACDRQGSRKLEQRTTPGQGLFLQSYCISTVPGGQMEDDCRDAGGRVASGAATESNAGDWQVTYTDVGK